MKKYSHLSDGERLYIQMGLRAGKKQNEIALEMGRSPSTVSREIRRNRFKRACLYTHYWACYLNRWRKRYRYRKLSAINTKIKAEVADQVTALIKQYLSPEQTANYLSQHLGVSISHETIYRFIHSDRQRRAHLKPYLRHGRKTRRKRYGSGQRAQRIPNRRPISERPKVVAERKRLGDWECDTIFGGDRKSAIVTVVERKSLFTLMAVVKQKTAKQVSQSMIRMLKPYADQVITLTFDNGSEFMLHEKIGKALGAKTYFANPYASWERGTNENTNGLIRQFFPKGTDFNGVERKEIKRVLHLLNNRPRKSRKYQSPNQIFNQQFVPLINC